MIKIYWLSFTIFWSQSEKLWLNSIAIFTCIYTYFSSLSLLNRKQAALFFPLLLLLFSTSCDLIKPTEQPPAYLQINQFEFTTTASQGTDSEQITDVWVYVNDISLGVYELPATVPVLDLGTQSVNLFPVIRENGIRSTPAIYPFYQRYETSIDLVANETSIIQPTTSFSDQTIFELVEDFNTGNHSLKGGDPNAVRIVNGVGQILLNEKTEVAFTTSQTFLDLPISGGLAVFLEIDYKTNVEFEIGLVGLDDNPNNPINATIYKVILSPINRWNKVYINFQDELSLSQLPGYKIAFRASIENNTSTNDPPEVLIDNIKFISLKN